MQSIRLNLGCGPALMEGFVNVDIFAWPGVDVIADLDQPWPFEDGSCEFIVAAHVLEHLTEPVLFMKEAWRVLRSGSKSPHSGHNPDVKWKTTPGRESLCEACDNPAGVLQVCVPYYKHANAFSD